VTQGGHVEEGLVARTSNDTLPRRVTDVALRRYLAKLAVRWSPVIVCAISLALVVATSGTSGTRGSTTLSGLLSPGRPSLRSSRAVSGQPAVGHGSLPPGGHAASEAPGSIPSTGLPTAGEPAGTAQGTTSARLGGTTVTGVVCRPGVKQFSWSAYAPPCVPAFHGSNGGATSHGVTATTITLTYRLANSSQQAIIDSVGGSAVPSQHAYLQDLETYANFFNTQFELYGRRVVIKPFQGQGDYVLEDEGQDLQGAQADAATAYSLGAFGDITFLLTSSQPYEQDLAGEHVLSFSPTGMPQSWFAQYAPYEWSIWATGTKIAESYVNTVCGRMAGMPAIFAGQASLRSQTRRFGLLTPDNPDYVRVGSEIQAGLPHCGVALARSETYSLNYAEASQEGTAAMAGFHAAGVTTVLCMCDPVMPIFFTQAASGQGYYPEWVVPNYLDPAGQQVSQSQWAHAISIDGWPTPPPGQSEAYHAYELANPGRQPAEQYYMVAYCTLLQVFEGLQAAGPDLTPQTFYRGMSSLPQSAPGQLGTWAYGSGAFTPPIDTLLEWWDPAATSNIDDKQGAFVPCDSGHWVTYANPDSWAPLHQQLACFNGPG